MGGDAHQVLPLPCLSNERHRQLPRGQGLTRLALSTLSRKGKNASELSETPSSFAIQAFFSASVKRAGASSNRAFHLTRSSS